METTEDSSARYFPLSQTIGAEYVFLFAMSRTIADSSGRYYLLSPTIRDEYVFHFSMFNRLSDRYPGRAQKHTPPAHLSSTPTPFAGRLVGRMQYAPTLPAEKSNLKGWCGIMFGSRGDEYVFHSIMSNRLSDRYPGRGVLNTLHIDSTSTPSPLAGRLVGRMQYAPTLPAEKSDLKDWCGITFRRRGDEYVFHSIMSNRLSDGYPGRGVLNTPHIDSTSTHSPFAGRLVGRMQYAPTFPEKDKVFLGRYYLLSRAIRDSLIRRTKKGRFFGERIGGRRYSANGSDLFCRVNHKRE